MRILIADDESNARYALRALVEEQPQWEVVADAADAGELLAQARATCPDLVLLDWELPEWSGAALLDALHGACPGAYVIALSGRPEARQSALAAGADAFVSKVDPPERLLAAIESAEQPGF